MSHITCQLFCAPNILVSFIADLVVTKHSCYPKKRCSFKPLVNNNFIQFLPTMANRKTRLKTKRPSPNPRKPRSKRGKTACGGGDASAAPIATSTAFVDAPTPRRSTRSSNSPLAQPKSKSPSSAQRSSRRLARLSPETTAPLLSLAQEPLSNEEEPPVVGSPTSNDAKSPPRTPYCCSQNR